MILTAVKINKYNKYHFSEQCWSETVVLAGVLPGTWSVGRPRCVCSVHPEPSERTAGPASCGVLPTESDTDASTSPRPDCTPEERREVRREIHRSQSEDGGRVSTAAVLTRAWKEDTEKTPRRPSMLLEGRLATARRLLGLGSSLPCRLDR